MDITHKMVLFVKPSKKIIYEPFTVAVAAIRISFLKPVIFLENVWRFYQSSQKIDDEAWINLSHLMVLAYAQLFNC